MEGVSKGYGLKGEKACSSVEDLLLGLGVAASSSQDDFVLARSSAPAWLRDAIQCMGVEAQTVSANNSSEEHVQIPSPRNPGEEEHLAHVLETILAPEAILFDMDGVLADVSLSYRQAIVITAEFFGVTVTLEEITVAKEAGDANNDWILTQRLLQERGKSVSLGEVTRVFEEQYQGTSDAPGLWTKEKLLLSSELLRRLAQRFPLAVVTGRPRRDAIRLLEFHDISDCFQLLVCMEDAPPKPDPAPVRLALEQLGVQRAWMLGDTPDDIRAASQARVLPLGIVAPGDNADAMAQVLMGSGAACVLSKVSDIEELLR